MRPDAPSRNHNDRRWWFVAFVIVVMLASHLTTVTAAGASQPTDPESLLEVGQLSEIPGPDVAPVTPPTPVQQLETVENTSVLSGSDLGAAQSVTFVGGGWGHGVGMSQYGALGQAYEGKTATKIVEYFYTGAKVKKIESTDVPASYLSPARPLWVGLDQSLSTVSATVTNGSATVCMTPGSCGTTISAKSGDDLTVYFNSAGTACKLKKNGNVVKKNGSAVKSPDCRVRIDPKGSGRVALLGGEYRRGAIEIRQAPGTTTFHVAAALALESYVYGLAEVPSYWPTAALKAQAMAARSYALYKFILHENPAARSSGDPGLSSSRQGDCWCHVYDSTLDQVYGGWPAENGPWTSAVDASADKVITYSGANSSSYTQSTVIPAFYSSSTTGVTESNVTGWGSPSLVPYLKSVSDPWSADLSVNPTNASWDVTFTASSVAGVFGWDKLRKVKLVSKAPGAVVRFDGVKNGALVSAERTGYEVRSLFGLKSPGLDAIEMSGPRCAGLFATHVGTSTADKIIGTDGRDVITGRGGRDVIEARGGRDIICGGRGSDNIFSGAGNDSVHAGRGNDKVRGGGGADTLRGRNGSDTLIGGVAGDVLRGGSGGDTLKGGKGFDTLHGDAGGDTASGEQGDDKIHGGPGADVLKGNSGKDVLRGDAGADDLNGGISSDTCVGGSGKDEAARCESITGVP